MAYLDREEAEDKIQHNSAITEGDMRKMYTSKVLSNENPKSLLRKVFTEISINFGHRGREGCYSIVIKTDDKVMYVLCVCEIYASYLYVLSVCYACVDPFNEYGRNPQFSNIQGLAIYQSTFAQVMSSNKF